MNLTNIAGGIGLFLLGMWLLTEGLQLAAGPALERILARSTSTRLRGLAAGILVTSLVQSSSAVTVAAIGFVNAGLLTLSQALWVLFGANVGTTMTGWLVAATGFGFRIEAAALPLIGAGMLLHLSGPGSRRGALGMALAGSGLLFLGIDFLKDAFTGIAAGFALPAASGALMIIAHVIAGAVITALVQSSSAALAITLTAAEGGMLPLEAAAAVVIGANLGTTLTGVIAALGATANARRAAAAHVLFNLLTGAVALLVLPWLLQAIVALRDALGMEHAPATALALFHTMFNLLGVLLMWPLSEQLTLFLSKRFRSVEEDAAQPRHLDDNTAAVPALALVALEKEIARLGEMALALLQRALAGSDAARIVHDAQTTTRLKLAIGQFLTRLSRAKLSGENALRLSRLLRALRYYDTVAELAQAIAIGAAEPALPGDLPAMQATRALAAQIDALCREAAPATATAGLDRLEARYQALKADLLQAGAQGDIGMPEMETLLRRASLARRAAEQAVKALRTLAGLRAAAPATGVTEGADENAVSA